MKLSEKLATARTATQRQQVVDKETTVGRHAICPNLVLCIGATGKRHYEVRATIAGTKGKDGKRDGIVPTKALPTHLFTLAKAEEVMRGWVMQCQAGNDPRLSDEQLELKAQTFLTFWATHASAIMVTAGEKGTPFSAKEQLAWHRAVGTFVDEGGSIKAKPDADKSSSLVALHNKMLHQIDINMVEAVLKPIYAEGGATPRRTRHKLERIFTQAKLRNLVKVNPVTDVIKLNGLKDEHVVEQHPCIHFDKLPAFMRDLRYDGEFTSRILEIMILTTTRSQEVRGMRWEEIDWNAEGGPIWIVPAERMKRKLAHIIPLPTQVVFLLKALGVKKEGLVFPSRWGVRETKEGHVEGNALISALRDRFELVNEKGEVVVPHGFRSTFGDYISEKTDFAEDLRELQLAHRRRVKDEKGNDLVSPAVVAAYARMTKVEKRRPMLQAYADYAFSLINDNVVQLKAVA